MEVNLSNVECDAQASGFGSHEMAPKLFHVACLDCNKNWAANRNRRGLLTVG